MTNINNTGPEGPGVVENRLGTANLTVGGGNFELRRAIVSNEGGATTGRPELSGIVSDERASVMAGGDYNERGYRWGEDKNGQFRQEFNVKRRIKNTMDGVIGAALSLAGSTVLGLFPYMILSTGTIATLSAPALFLMWGLALSSVVFAGLTIYVLYKALKVLALGHY